MSNKLLEQQQFRFSAVNGTFKIADAIIMNFVVDWSAEAIFPNIFPLGLKGAALANHGPWKVSFGRCWHWIGEVIPVAV